MSPEIDCYLQQGNRRIYNEDRLGIAGRSEIDEEKVMRPPLKGISNPIPVQKEIYAEEQERIINKQIEDLVATRKELRKVRRIKQEQEENGVNNNRTGNEGRNLPRVIENKMIVPPRNNERREEFPPLRETNGLKWTTVVSKNKKKKIEMEDIRNREIGKEPNRNMIRSRNHPEEEYRKLRR